jgi:PAS domain S-box-containing protein
MALHNHNLEKRVRNSQKQLSMVIESISDGFFVLDDRLVVTYFNSAAENLLGRERQDVIGRNLFEAFPEARGSIFEEKYTKALKENTPLSFETYFGGEPYANWYDVRVYPFEQGISVYFQVTTARKRAKEELERKERMLSRTEAVANLGSWEWDVVKDTVIWSDELFRIFQLPPTDKAPSFEDHPKLYHPEDMERLREVVNKALTHGTPYEIELRAMRADGETRFCLARGHAVVEQDGAVSHLYGSLQDITERKRAQEERESLRRQLSQAQKMEALGTLTGGIAHDFNNLLTIINGYTEMLLSAKPEDDPERSDLQKILETGLKGAELVQKFSALSKKDEISPQPLELNCIVKDFVSLIERTFPKMIEIETNLSENLNRIKADTLQLEQVLMNLCVNAKEAMPEGGLLGIETGNVFVDEDYCRLHPGAKPGAHVFLGVSDTGGGMSEDTVARIFDPFFTTKGWDFQKGTGLGLSVAKGIIEQHGGWITCESGPGKGTTFRIYAPAIVEVPKAEQTPSEKQQSPQDGRILLVDDEELVGALGKRIMERAGYEVITASNGKEALEVYSSEYPNIALVILDLVMPQMGGEECLNEMLKINSDLKVVFSSGNPLLPQERDRLARHVEGFVDKPYQAQRLLEVIREVLESR